MVNPVLFNRIYGALFKEERHFFSFEKETAGYSPYPFTSTGTFGGCLTQEVTVLRGTHP